MLYILFKIYNSGCERSVSMNFVIYVFLINCLLTTSKMYQTVGSYSKKFNRTIDQASMQFLKRYSQCYTVVKCISSRCNLYQAMIFDVLQCHYFMNYFSYYVNDWYLSILWYSLKNQNRIIWFGSFWKST